MSAEMFPDRSMSYREKIDWMLESNGWALIPVPADPEADPPVPGYAYTVGLTGGWSFPEVVVFGLTPVAARGIVGELVDIVRSGAQVPIGEAFIGLFDSGLRSALLTVPDAGGLCPAADEWNGVGAYEVVQLTWPDRNGWLPWEPGFEHRLTLAQPVVGDVPD